MKQILITMLLLLGAMCVSAQARTVRSDSAEIAKYKQQIGLDLSVPDFNTKKIDSKIMGPRLANFLDYLFENYNQGTYERQIAHLLSEQNEALEKLYFTVKKIKLMNVSKQGNVINILLKVCLGKNAANIMQTDLTLRFVDGVSDNETTNDLFSYMSRYVQARERLQKE